MLIKNISQNFALGIIKKEWAALSIQTIPPKTLPMKKHFTSLSNTEFAALVRKAVRQEKAVEPKETTLQLLKNLARNYRAIPQVPEELCGYVLS